MKITEEILEEVFDKCNVKYFEDELPTPNFALLKSYRTLGLFTHDYRSPKNKVLKGQKISISEYIDWEEEDLEEVMTHEMVHYYVEYKNMHPKKPHGEEFMSVAERLNKKYGLHISKRVDARNFRRLEDAPKMSWFLAHII